MDWNPRPAHLSRARADALGMTELLEGYVDGMSLRDAAAPALFGARDAGRARSASTSCSRAASATAGTTSTSRCRCRAGATLATLLDEAERRGIPLREALADSPHLRHTLMLNGERCPVDENLDRALADGDEVYLLAPLAGG